MTSDSPIPRYGVHVQTRSSTDVERAAESLRLAGYAVLDSGLDGAALDALRARFDAVRARSFVEHGEERLRGLGEHNTIRCPLYYDRAFLELALNARLLELCHSALGTGFILNQQNGLVNPAAGEHYSQGAYHRDLPYQHFVSSRALALNAVFCLDDFTADNGATLVIPASHKEENLPSDALIRDTEKALAAPAGAFLVLDCMTYHRGGLNRTPRDRRAINHVYSMAHLRQQIDLPAFLGEAYSSDPAIRRLLGYDFRAPASAREYYAMRERRKPA